MEDWNGEVNSFFQFTMNVYVMMLKEVDDHHDTSLTDLFCL